MPRTLKGNPIYRTTHIRAMGPGRLKSSEIVDGGSDVRSCVVQMFFEVEVRV